MTPGRLAAATVLAGLLLLLVGVVAVWILLPIAGAALTFAAGGLLVVTGYRALLRVPR